EQTRCLKPQASRILACWALLLYPAFQRQLALELLAGDLAAEQPGEDHDRFVGATAAVPRRFRRGRRSKDLNVDPAAFERHRLQKSHCPEGAGTIEEPLVHEMKAPRRTRAAYGIL